MIPTLVNTLLNNLVSNLVSIVKEIQDPNSGQHFGQQLDFENGQHKGRYDPNSGQNFGQPILYSHNHLKSIITSVRTVSTKTESLQSARF